MEAIHKSQGRVKKVSPHIQEMRARLALNNKEISPLTQKLGEEVISVDQISSQLAHFYEKMRYSVDYKEEHLLRRNAIKRMLKRRLQEQFRKGRIAPFLVVELVRAGYLPNDSLPERIIDDVEHIIEKALTLYEATPDSEKEFYGSSEHFDRIIGIAAMEIEEFLFPTAVAGICLDTFYLTVYNLIEVRDIEIDEDQKNMQVYIACNRSLLGYDESDLFYVLWTLKYNNWKNKPTGKEIELMGQEFDKHVQEILVEIRHPLNWRIMPKLRDYTICFALMRESLQSDGGVWCKKQLDMTVVKESLSEILSRKYEHERNLIGKSVNRAIIYILLTKTILAFLFELPYDLWAHGKINKLALGINIFFHPLLLYIVTRVVRLPKLDSKEYTIQSIAAIISNKKLPQIPVTFARKKSFFGMILSALYLFFFVLIFGLIIWVLQKLEFNIVSGSLFVFFLTLVSYFGLRLRGRAKKWRIKPKDVSAKAFMIDLLTLPIVQSGQWFIKKFETVNIFVFVMDFLIETPFKVLIDIFEGFTQYLREKKERLE